MPGTHHKHSPSKLDRIRACPGSVRACAELPDEDLDNYEVGKDAAEGIMLHAVMAGDIKDDDLNREQADIIAECREYDTVHFGDADTLLREQHVALLDDDFTVITEGTADLIALYKGTVRQSTTIADADIITPAMARALDYKMGRRWVNPDSLQCKAYSAAIMQTHGVGAVEFHIQQPRAGHGKPIIFNDFDALRAEVKAVIAAAADINAPLCPGDHCRYCPARLTCTAATGQQTALMERSAFDLADPATLGRAAQVAQLVKKRCDEVLARCKAETMDGAATGWRIVDRAGRKRITNAQTAYESIQEFIALPDYLAMLDVPMGKFKDAVVPRIKDACGVKTKEAEALLWERLGEVVQQGDPSKVMVIEKGDGK